ncbi:reverse transcriptase domain-containing protein [Tanacetum coccineum]
MTMDPLIGACSAVFIFFIWYSFKSAPTVVSRAITDALTAHDADRNTNGRHRRHCRIDPTGLEMETVLVVKQLLRENQSSFPLDSLAGKLHGGTPTLSDCCHDVAVVASSPKTKQGAIETTTVLWIRKSVLLLNVRQRTKRKQDDNQQQQQNKRQNTGRAYTAGSGEKKPYGGSKPLCAKCNITTMVHVLPNATSATELAIWPATVGVLRILMLVTIRGALGQLKNNNRGNPVGNGNAPEKVYAVGRAGTNPDSNVVTGTFLLNNRYASVLFDTSTDRSFISTAFSSHIDITPSTLDHYYDVELADGKMIWLNAIIRGCTLNFLNHPFNIDLMPIELGCLDVIIGMDWLAKYKLSLLCTVKNRSFIPWGIGNGNVVIVRGDGSDQGNETRLNIISCTKTQKYLLKGCPVFFSHVTTKETEDKSEKK